MSTGESGGPGAIVGDGRQDGPSWSEDGGGGDRGGDYIPGPNIAGWLNPGAGSVSCWRGPPRRHQLVGRKGCVRAREGDGEEKRVASGVCA